MANTYLTYVIGSGFVDNSIMLNSHDDWSHPEGMGLLEAVPSTRQEWFWNGTDWVIADVPDQYGAIGDTWTGVMFVAPESPKPPPLVDPNQPSTSNTQAF